MHKMARRLSAPLTVHAWVMQALQRGLVISLAARLMWSPATWSPHPFWLLLLLSLLRCAPAAPLPDCMQSDSKLQVIHTAALHSLSRGFHEEALQE